MDFDKGAYFEYYPNSVETSHSNFNGKSNTPKNISRQNKGSHRGATHLMSTQSNIGSSSLTQPLSQPTLWSSTTMTSYEKEHYKRALKEIYDAVKLRTQRLDTESGSDEAMQLEEERQSSQNDSFSPKSGSEGSTLKVRKHQPKKKKLNETELQEIYQELRGISQKLKDETRELQAWEDNLQEREAMLHNHENIATTQHELVHETLEDEIQRRCSIIDEEYQAHLNELQKVIYEKSKEANRLRDSFNTIRTTHEDLRKQFLEVQDQNRLLESQTLSLQQRLNNLLRKNEYQVKKDEEAKTVKFDGQISLATKRNNDDSLKAATASKFRVSGILEVLSCLFIWISDSQLDYTTTYSSEGREQEEKSKFSEAVYGKCVKILPPLADLLSYLPAVNPNVMYPLLKFIYSVILYTEHSPQGTQKTVLVSTLRRIGEELYKPEVFKQPELRPDMKKNKSKAQIYIHSLNLDERMLSTLIILKTISRADYLSHTFDILKCDLRGEEIGSDHFKCTFSGGGGTVTATQGSPSQCLNALGKRLFIVHSGVKVILPFMKPKNNVFLEFAVDVTLQMSMESGVVAEFLAHCSTSDFFNVCTNLLQEKGLELKILEKLSIILQRLSKIRTNRRYFEAFQLVPLMQELLRQYDSDNAFLSLNLRSVLVNINVV